MHKKFSIRRLIGMISAALMISGAGFIAIEAPANAVLGDDSEIDYSTSLDGTSQYWQVDEGTAFNARNVYTASAWFKMSSFTSPREYNIISHDGDYILYVKDGFLVAYIYYNGTGQGQQYTTSFTPVVGRWTHAAVTRNGSALKIYVDGKSIYSATLPSANPSTYSAEYPLKVGYHYGIGTGSTSTFAGEIDEVKIWSIARTESEIAADMHAYQTNAVNTTGLVAYYDFNEGSGTTAYNRVGTTSTNLTSTGASGFTDVKTITKNSGKTIVTFPRSYLTPSGGWKVPAGMTKANALVVAGGGGGASRHAGGGGAGEVGSYSLLSLTPGATMRIKVGAGGLGHTSSVNNGDNSGNSGQSSILGLDEFLGGGGGQGGTGNVRNGGSGGGTAGSSTAGGLGVSGTGTTSSTTLSRYVRAGGSGSNNGGTAWFGGGGGGAASAGSSGTNSAAGAGGQGFSSSITGAPACYAAGGGGGASNAASGAAGTCVNGATTTAGAGSTSSASNIANHAAANSGSGGGGGGLNGSDDQPGGNGGSGIIVIAYAEQTEDTAFDFPGGTDAQLRAVNKQLIPNKSSFTFETWFKADTLGVGAAWDDMFRQQATDSNYQAFGLGVYNGQIQFVHSIENSDAGTLNTVGTDVPNLKVKSNQWYHVALATTYSLSGSSHSYNWKVYVDGSFVKEYSYTTTSPSNQGSAQLSIGNLYSGTNSRAWDGQIDQIKVWNGALTQSEIVRSMHAYASESVVDTSSSTLRAHYDFNTATTTALKDQTSNGYDFTLMSGATAPSVYQIARESTSSGTTTYKFEKSIQTTWGGWFSKNSLSSASVLVVGAGGGAGKGVSGTAGPGASGGGGGVSSLTDVNISSGSVHTIVVGQAGLGATSAADNATTRNGQSTTFSSTTALGGGGGGSRGYAGAGSGVGDTTIATGGGGAIWLTSATCENYSSGSGVVASGNNAARGRWGWSGAGGGARGPATDGSCGGANQSQPGPGATSSLSGVETTYGKGGWAGPYESRPTLAPNTGTGGSVQYGASAPASGEGTAGTSGVVIVSVKTANAITFDANTGTGTLATQYVSVGSSANLTSIGSSISKSNYTFAGWATTSGGAVAYADGASITPSGDMTLYAKWTASSVNVTFVTNSGSSLTATISAIGGTLAQPGATTRSGYTFAGWYVASDLSGSAIASWPYTHGQTADFSLYAKWTANTYTITYKAGTGGSGSDLTQTFTTGNTATLKDATAALTKTGHSISGWSTSNGGSQTNALSSSYSTTADLTLYPVWTANTYTITYRAGTGGTGSNLTQTFVYGNTATLKDATAALTRTGYAISGWSTTDGGSQVHALSGSYSAASDLTLYPVWSANTYTITYKAGTSGTGSDITQTFVYGNTATLRDATAPITRDGYSISGWSTTNGGSQTNALSGSYSSASNLILYPVWSANSYNVTYDEQGGSSVTDATYQTAGNLALPGTPTRNGYTFRGWYNASTGGTKLGNASATINPTTTADITIYAQWTAIDYSVTYNNNNATGGSVPSDVTVYHYGDNVAVRGNTGNLSLEGYSFGGWTTTQNSGTAYNSGEVLVISGNLTFYVKWSANTYTVTYDTNGASGSPSVSTKSYTTGGTAITHPTVGSMARTGYTFGGWSETANGAALTGTYTTAADKTLYAVWTIKSINVTYAKGEASSSTVNTFPSNTSGNYGTRITLSSSVSSLVTISGATNRFVGWSDGTSIYSPGASYLLGDSAPTFTAQWVRVFEVRYSLNGGSGILPDDDECITSNGSGGFLCNDQQIIRASSSPSRTGYSFTGWQDQSGNPIAAGAQFTVSTSSYLLYAQWTPTNYGVTYYAAGGSTPPTALTKNYGDIFTVGLAVTRTGYTFAGWSDGTTTYGVGASYQMPANNVSLTAQWTPNVYTVTYDWNGGTGSATANASYTVGTSGLTLPTVGNHVKDGYSFGGWSETRGGIALSGPYSPTASLALYAVWTLGNYTVTYDANGGTVGTSSAQVTNGGSVTLPTPTRTSYVFDGWYTAASGGTKHGNAGATFTPSASSTVYAHWIQESLYGINPAHLTRLASVNASSGVQTNITGSNAGSSVQVVVPAGAFAQNGTTVNIDLVGDFSRADSLLSDPNAYIVSMVVSWVAPDGTVPNTAAGKPIAVTIQNATIKAGSKIYSILGANVTVLGTATQDGTVTVSLTEDPEIVVAATVPDSPTTVTATAGSTGSAIVNWNAPTSNGGATITGYTVTASTGQTCTSATTSCIVSGLTSGASYTFTVVATNSVGNSSASTASSSLAVGSAPLSSSPNVGGGTPLKAPLAVGDKNMQIIAVDKKKVATTGGSVVKLDTRNISKITEVTVDGKKAKIISTVDGQIKVEMPKNTSGEAKVVLSGPDGQVTLEQVISYAAPKPVATVKSIAIPQGIWTIATPEMQKLKTTLAKNADAVVITCEGYQSYSYNTAFDALVAKQRAKTACAYLAGGNSSITVVTKVVRTKLTGPASRKLKVTFSAVR